MQLPTRVGGDKAYWVWKVKNRRINRHKKKMKIDLKTDLHDYLNEMDLGTKWRLPCPRFPELTERK